MVNRDPNIINNAKLKWPQYFIERHTLSDWRKTESCSKKPSLDIKTQVSLKKKDETKYTIQMIIK